MNIFNQLTDMAKNGVASIGTGFGNLYEGVTSRVIAASNAVSETYQSAKKYVSDTIEQTKNDMMSRSVRFFTPTVIKVTEELSEKEGKKLLDIVKGIELSDIYNAFANATDTENGVNRAAATIASKLDQVQQKYSEYAEESTNPLTPSAKKMMDNVFDELKNVLKSPELGKNTIKKAAEVLEEARPAIEKQVSSSFFNWIFGPIMNIINFFLQLFFAPNERKTTNIVPNSKQEATLPSYKGKVPTGCMFENKDFAPKSNCTSEFSPSPV